jgi:catechol 2,3-dioxygenase-like lactoylglutathione lyase family enzyme
MTVLRRVARNVVSLPAAAKFYEKLGFAPVDDVRDDEALAACLGLARVRILRLQRGAQELELSACLPDGKPYPAVAAANDLVFQHIALVTADIEAARAHALEAGARAISLDGPQSLPISSGGVKAWKFRDPQGHPLEFLQFPDPAKNAVGGYDHTAISVSDVARSEAFYEKFGFVRTAAQVNTGPQQDRLDGLTGVVVDVVALTGAMDTPHLELLQYRAPRGRAVAALTANALAADRIVLSASSEKLALRFDPDGHAILLDGR